MEDTLTLNKVNIIAGRKVKTNYHRAAISPKKNKIFPEIERLIAEGGRNFYRYIRWQGLANDPNILVLSSKHHYYYEENELKCTSALIILSKLNIIKHIDSFLQSLNFVLPQGASFIGCFYDSDTRTGSGLISKLNKGFENFLNPKIDRKYDREDVSRLLESHGFQVIDMTFINGLTYFKTRNNRRLIE